MNEPTHVCFDCNAPVAITTEVPSDTVILCGRDWSKRYENAQFDDMPKTMNFGNSLKLKIHGRPVVQGPRIFEQNQTGRVR